MVRLEVRSWDQLIDISRYVVSLLLKPVLGGCNTFVLRTLNVAAICITYLVAFDILRTLRDLQPSSTRKTRRSPGQENKVSRKDDETELLDAHSAFNISLFPPLFFFCALYYTDVLSTLVVLLNYRIYVKGRSGKGALWTVFSTVLGGIVALAFRQTNIFWVAVFPAGLAVIDALKGNATNAQANNGRETIDVLSQSWSEGRVYDVSVGDANILGMAASINYKNRTDFWETASWWSYQWHWPRSGRQ